MIETRRVAAERGHKTYETGKPCKYGHVAPRYTANGACAICMSARSIEYQRRLREIMRSESTARLPCDTGGHERVKMLHQRRDENET